VRLAAKFGDLKLARETGDVIAGRSRGCALESGSNVPPEKRPSFVGCPLTSCRCRLSNAEQRGAVVLKVEMVELAFSQRG
jgi:hypothetical protein